MCGHGLNHLSGWRRRAKDGELVLPASEGDTDFAALVMFVVERSPLAEETGSAFSAIEITAGSISVRLDGATPAAAETGGIVRALGGANDLSIQRGGHIGGDSACGLWRPRRAGLGGATQRPVTHCGVPGQAQGLPEAALSRGVGPRPLLIWLTSLTATPCESRGVETCYEEEALMEKVSILTLDVAKNSFHVHGAAEDGSKLLVRR